MEFRVLFYEHVGVDGVTVTIPLRTFLADLRRQQPDLEKLLVAGLMKLRDLRYHGPPLTEQVDAEHKIYELRVGRANIARLFFFFQRGQVIVVTHGYVKKQQKLDLGELARARTYQRDWEERNG